MSHSRAPHGPPERDYGITRSYRVDKATLSTYRRADMTNVAPRNRGIMRFWRTCLAVLSTAAVGSIGHAATVFNFQNFNDCSPLQLNGNAACTGGVLRVTPATFNQAGSAFSMTLVPLGAGATFSTFFTFRFTSPGGSAD